MSGAGEMESGESSVRLEVVGPEGVPLGFPAAEAGERLTAFLLDVVFIVFIVGILFVGTLLVAGLTLSAAPLGLFLVAFFLLRHFYFTLFELHWQGATPGKRIMKLKVIARDGRGLTSSAIIARNLMRDVELFIPLVTLASPEALVGELPGYVQLPSALWVVLMFFFPFFTRERVRVGDLVGGTLVIRLPKAALHRDEGERQSVRPGAPAEAHAERFVFTSAQLSHYGEKELEALAELIRKADQGKATPNDLVTVAAVIARKVAWSGPEPRSDPESFLRAFYRAQRTNLEQRLLFGKRKADKHTR